MRPRARSLALALALGVAAPACSATSTEAPPCGRPGNQWILAAQSVPSATFLPCIDSLPTGWTVTGSRFERASYTVWLDSDRAGIDALQIRLSRTCDISRAVEIPVVAGPSGIRSYEEPIGLPPRFQANRYQVFEGGCITYAFRFTQPVSPTLALEVQQALDVEPRARIQRALQEFGLDLCGAGAPPCPG